MKRRMKQLREFLIDVAVVSVGSVIVMVAFAICPPWRKKPEED